MSSCFNCCLVGGGGRQRRDAPPKSPFAQSMVGHPMLIPEGEAVQHAEEILS